MKIKLLLCALFICSTISFSQNVAYDSVSINNINARINNNGNLFWDLVSASKFEVPKGSGKTSLFSSTLWVAGLDSIDTLHCAAEMYRQLGEDYWSGPISSIYDSTYDAKWNKIWKIKKSDIDYHLAHCWQAGYVPIQALIDWPGNGDVALGQLAITAPFKDWNNDGVYNPYNGDYPLIKGDEAVYFIINDSRNNHTESGGNKLGIEVHSMAYAFDCPADSALWNTLFINYKIINRSAYTYHDCFIGNFTDTDLGEAKDDYIGCDVERGAFFVYNGDDVDGTGKPQDYGQNPPAQAVVFLAGAGVPDDGIDNPYGFCDAGLNGFHYGNGISDDERYGLNRFVYFYNGGPAYQSDPVIGVDYYNLLKGFWKDSTKMMYGGNGHTSSGAYGPECNFMFPGDSDSCNWGTGGNAPNGPTYWTEVTAGNVPDDRRGMGSTGPFTFNPDDVQQLDIAFIFGRDYINPTAWDGVTVMQQRIDSIRSYFVNDSTPCGGSFSSIVPVVKKTFSTNIYPNPASDFITVEFETESTNIEYSVFNIVGEKVISGTSKTTTNPVIKISELKPGLYFVKISVGLTTFSKKFIKR